MVVQHWQDWVSALAYLISPVISSIYLFIKCFFLILGAMATPYVAQVLLQTSVTSAVTIYGIFAVFASIACLLLPYETRGNDMAS